MRMQSWVYPWDVAASGVERTLARMRDAGLHGLDLASNYHPIATLSPRRGGRRIFYSDRGAVFFPARAERYGRIRPEIWPEQEVIDVWPQVARTIGRHGLRLNAWTICLFQPWIALRHPDCSRCTAEGDAVPATVCPAHPDVREFFAHMCADLAGQYPIDLIELEGVSPHTYDYGWVRPRILAEVGSWTQWLLGLCFCVACRSRARAHGIAIDALQGAVADEIGASLARDDAAAMPQEEALAIWLQGHPDLAAFLSMQEDASVEFVRTVAAAVAEVSTSCRTAVYAPVQFDGSPGVDLDRVLDVIGAVIVTRPIDRPDYAKRLRERIDRCGRFVETVHFQACGWPHQIGAPALRDELASGLALAPHQVSFYNYGLLKDAQIRELVRLAAAIRAESASLNPGPDTMPRVSAVRTPP